MFNWLSNTFNKSKNLIGLDIGTSAIKLVEMDANKMIVHHALAPLPPGAVVNKEVHDGHAVTQALKRVLDDWNSTCKNVAIAIPDNQIMSKVIQLDAGLSESEIETHLSLESEKYFSYPLADIHFDFHIQDKSASANNLANNFEVVDVLLVAARKDVCEARITPIQAAGLQVQIMDIEAYAIERAIIQNKDFVQTGLLAVVDLGISMMTLHILKKAQCIFTRSEIVMPTETEHNAAVLTKLQRLMQFFFSTHHADEIQQILLAGGLALVPDLEKQIAETLQINVGIADPFIATPFADDRTRENLISIAPRMLLSCGLAKQPFVTS